MCTGKRVVSRDRQTLGQAFVYTLGIMAKGRCLAVQDLAGLADIAAVDVQYALPVQTISYLKGISQVYDTYCPMQTPKIGILPAKCRIASRLTPESVFGWPGPGLTTS